MGLTLPLNCDELSGTPTSVPDISSPSEMDAWTDGGC